MVLNSNPMKTMVSGIRLRKKKSKKYLSEYNNMARPKEKSLTHNNHCKKIPQVIENIKEL